MDPLPGYPGRKPKPATEPAWSWRVGLWLIGLGWLAVLAGILAERIQ